MRSLITFLSTHVHYEHLIYINKEISKKQQQDAMSSIYNIFSHVIKKSLPCHMQATYARFCYLTSNTSQVLGLTSHCIRSGWFESSLVPFLDYMASSACHSILKLTCSKIRCNVIKTECACRMIYIPVYSTSLDYGLSTRKPIE